MTYDSLNRITGALTTSTHATSPAHCWGESYTLDAWGNLNAIAATTNSNYTGCTQESGFSTTADGNNHLPAWAYDASGNATSDSTYSYAYDAESQIKTANGVTYTYDGEGRRVSKSSGKLYWYGSGGDILAETDTSGNTTAEYIFFGGKRIAMLPAGGNPIYYVEDLLGTSRVITTNSGVVCYDADFYPFGGERAYTNTCPQNYKFEGKERDTETGNDDFGARYYSNRFGRWLSADWSSVPVPVPYANLTNPQTLNLYAMVSDDPESFADLDGHCGGNVGTDYIPCPHNSRALQGEGADEGNSGIAAVECGISGESCTSAAEVAAQTSEIAAQQAANANANANQNQQQQQPNAPDNSRTDVVLYPRELPPAPQQGTYGGFWEMDWKVGACGASVASGCHQSTQNENQTVTLVEKVGNGEWKPTGDPTKGEAHDQISPEPKSFNQHWFVADPGGKPKQVQLVVGKDSKGNLIKTWEVHVEIKKHGDRPVYSPVP